ncbi:MULTISPECIES: hypothetical protein [unclassified Brevundimonas]|uniref:hypothetical protein n=1 Tax=unclassified Brevundimonas TaxID=2622653 RepID=UPI0025B9AB0E|nr:MULTISPECIES: hypothetical protein [unclassified Brevundimonas]
MKKLVRAQAGVKLERIKRPAARQKTETFYRLTNSRQASERVMFDKEQAHRAFAREVAASLQEKAVMDLDQDAFGH